MPTTAKESERCPSLAQPSTNKRKKGEGGKTYYQQVDRQEDQLCAEDLLDLFPQHLEEVSACLSTISQAHEALDECGGDPNAALLRLCHLPSAETRLGQKRSRRAATRQERHGEVLREAMRGSRPEERGKRIPAQRFPEWTPEVVQAPQPQNTPESGAAQDSQGEAEPRSEVPEDVPRTHSSVLLEALCRTSSREEQERILSRADQCAADKTEEECGRKMGEAVQALRAANRERKRAMQEWAWRRAEREKVRVGA